LIEVFRGATAGQQFEQSEMTTSAAITVAQPTDLPA
jgi:hypothetical protein